MSHYQQGRRKGAFSHCHVKLIKERIVSSYPTLFPLLSFPGFDHSDFIYDIASGSINLERHYLDDQNNVFGKR